MKIDWSVIREFFWPLLEKLSDEDLNKEAASLRVDISKIEINNWNDGCELALGEAKKLNELEEQRRASADSKAAIYLAAITALAPVLTSLIPGAITKFEGSKFIDGLSFVIFIYALINLLRAALWAFDTLKVSASHRVDVNELTDIWSGDEKKYEIKLIIANLSCVRRNRKGVNLKVTCIKMTHALLLRIFVAFFLLLLIQSANLLISKTNTDNDSSLNTINDKDDCGKLPDGIYRI
ncbi:hypothetical protein [Pantoea agglomerans]|uniref:hypothetical protein n=1 Tax=Enterobacter agglomerans TaxID=549 RepID=UPI00263BD0E1|nr:hypothetical protein [Pantoea agglomerans]MDN4623698.1 hypothetical protein [Pantoea agglomerans]